MTFCLQSQCTKLSRLEEDRLRRQPAKLMGFARVGSNPTVVASFCPTKIVHAQHLLRFDWFLCCWSKTALFSEKWPPKTPGFFGAGFRLLIDSVARSADIRSIIALPLCHAFLVMDLHSALSFQPSFSSLFDQKSHRPDLNRRPFAY